MLSLRPGSQFLPEKTSSIASSFVGRQKLEPARLIVVDHSGVALSRVKEKVGTGCLSGYLLTVGKKIVADALISPGIPYSESGEICHT